MIFYKWLFFHQCYIQEIIVVYTHSMLFHKIKHVPDVGGRPLDCLALVGHHHLVHAILLSIQTNYIVNRIFESERVNRNKEDESLDSTEKYKKVTAKTRKREKKWIKIITGKEFNATDNQKLATI